MSIVGNGDTYIVTSINTSKENIEKLKRHNLPIIFHDYEDAYYDEVGGFHDGGTGWNPKGLHCGECTMNSCKDCESRFIEPEDLEPQTDYYHSKECQECEHKNLCYGFLEYAGLIIGKKGNKIMPHICDEVRKDPESWYKQLQRDLDKYRYKVGYNNK